MQRPPRKPGTKIVNPPQILRWAITGFALAVTALAVLEWGPDQPSTTEPSASMTMAFAIVSLSAVNLGVVTRREREASWSWPVFPYFGWIILGLILTWAAVELGMLQRLLDTASLTGKAVDRRPRARPDRPSDRGGGQSNSTIASTTQARIISRSVRDRSPCQGVG